MFACPFNGNQRWARSVIKYPFNFSKQYRLSSSPSASDISTTMMSITWKNFGCVAILIMTSLSSPMTFTWVVSSCITCLALLRGTVFNYLKIDNGMTLEEDLDSTKQLWRFMLKASNVKRKGGTKGFPFLYTEQAFTFGLFFIFVGAWFSPWSLLVIGVSTDSSLVVESPFLGEFYTCPWPTCLPSIFLKLLLCCSLAWMILVYGCL
jgi:hypothetical protein